MDNNKDLKYKLPKIIRDKIPDVSTNNLEFRIEKDESRIKDFLFLKLLEEASETYKNRSKEEIWDLLDVVDEICEVMGFSMDEIENLRKEKNKKLGWFKKGVILEKTDYYD